MTSFGPALHLCGPDEKTVGFFIMSTETVRGWVDGSREVPAAASEMLAKPHCQIERAAERFRDMLDEAGTQFAAPERGHGHSRRRRDHEGLAANLRRLRMGLAADGAASA